MKNKFYSKTIKKIQKMQSAQPRYQMLGRSGTGKVHFFGFQTLITQMVNTNRNLIISAHVGTGKAIGVQPKFFEDVFTGLEYTSEQIEKIKNCIDAPSTRDVFSHSVKLTPEEYTEKTIKRAKDSIIVVDSYKIKDEKN